MKLNIGAGETYLEEYINIDSAFKVKCDVRADIKAGLPFKDSSFEQINALHILEHIELYNWPNFFTEIYRLLPRV